MWSAWFSLRLPRVDSAVDGAAAGGELDRCGAVVGGVVVAVAEPGDVAGVADQHRGDDRPDPEQVGDASCLTPRPRCGSACVTPSAARRGGGCRRAARRRGRSGSARPVSPGDSRARNASTSEALISLAIPPGASSTSSACIRHTTRRSLVTDVGVAFRQQPQHLAVSDRLDLAQIDGGAARSTRPTTRRSGRSCSTGPMPNTRVRAASVAGTFTTCSPAATSCWDSR